MVSERRYRFCLEKLIFNLLSIMLKDVAPLLSTINIVLLRKLEVDERKSSTAHPHPVKS
jgi:hypothetical protein